MAGGLLYRNVAVLFKTEVTYGTDPTPTGVANAVLASEVKLSPMEMKTVDRNLIRPFLGNSDKLPTQIYNRLEMTLELAGSGAAGTAPAMGPLLKACGFAETTSAGVSVAYAPVSSAFSSGAFHFNLDGVLHKGLGARGTVSFSLKNNERPVAKFVFTGLFVAVADGALPAVTLTSWKTPLPCNRTNTPTFLLHGYAGMLDDLQLDVANDVQYRGLIGGGEFVRIVDRKPKGSVLMEAVKVADKDWWTSIKDVTTGALSVIHGVTAGNIVEFAGPKVQVHTPSYQEQSGIAMLSAQLEILPNAGNDELVVTFR